ncbi:hypothetical protein LTR09_006244 [Extremus antarcticus]|uniref:RNA helicase n=1 Tax=Extremus antarcticus TaxID=702011 RepID=A0AAJ0DEW9_9PEZI|nr:hypothetical protein LTR09_006244 [Extremus antarcticus]
MPAGNKKKRKPVANPARGVATTSIQSKAKTETDDTESTEPSVTATPDIKEKIDAPGGKTAEASNEASQRELHELSPDELEAQLETAELQQFVEKYAVKIRKEASRQATRLQTDRRLLRGHSDFVSVKNWLPEELMQLVFEYAAITEDLQPPSGKPQILPVGDDLVAKVWTLRDVLLDTVSTERVNEVIGFLLNSHPTESSTGQIWGLDEALNWLAAQCEPAELPEYDVESTKGSAARVDDSSDSEVEAVVNGLAVKRDSPQSTVEQEDSGRGSAAGDMDFEVSDIDSDLEPDELLSVYLRTKAKLYEIDPLLDNMKSGKKTSRAPTLSKCNQPTGKGTSKLQQKLETIERDPLFDRREAEGQWANQRVELAREAADRRKLNLGVEPSQKLSGPKRATQNESLSIALQAESEANGFMDEGDESDNDALLSGMFDALPGVATTSESAKTGTGGPQDIMTRDFGRLTGMSPRRILEEACRARDPRSKVAYKQVSATTYACQYSVTIAWSKEQEQIDASYLKSVLVRSKPVRTTVTMVREATPDTAQSEAYVSTAALFVVFSGHPKEEKAQLRLPSAFRNLWDEFAKLKGEHSDAQDRTTVKDLRAMVEHHLSTAEEVDDDEDEVVFKASNKRLNGAASGASTPVTRPQTPTPKSQDISQSLQDLWSRKVATPSHQRMLLARMNLPMYHSKAIALETIGQNQVTIIVGDTGSGKSTQLPQFLLEHELSHGRQCKIYCTEPRRISALSLAQRVSEELGEHKTDIGTHRSLVGYAIRLESQTTSSTKLVYATVGIVLRMLENANGLNEVTHLVLDEVHERSIDTDFLLIVLKSLMQTRPDLKVVLMSATVDAQKFSKYLDNAPIVSVPGRTHPVEARFLEDAIELTGFTNDNNVPEKTVEADSESDEDAGKTGSQKIKGYSQSTVNTLAKYDEYRIDTDLIVKLVEQVAYLPDYQVFSKAILVFLPGLAEIRQLNDMLLGHKSFSKDWHIYALHSSFSSEDQQAAFDIPPPGVRKIVIATNIAETGITIPDVTCVIDTGKHREMRFDERRQMSRLTQSFVARANAKQRRGRAGRVQEGICFHLFTRYRFENLMAEQQSPEMLRLSLQDLVMRVKICRLGNIEEALAEALDPPSSKNIRRAIDALIEVGALTESEQLTPLGNQLAKLPLDAQLGKLILFGAAFGCLDFALTVAAALTSKTPFLSPLHAKKQADTVRLGFKRGDSDLLTLYNAYSAWRKVCTTAGFSERNFCNKNFLSPQNLANIEDLKAQLLSALADTGFVDLGQSERQALNRIRPGQRQRNFVTLPPQYCKSDVDDELTVSVVAWSFYPKIAKSEGKGWRNIANNASLGLHPMSVNKGKVSSEIRYLSFYSIMQSASKYTNAQETSPVSEFALILLAGDAVFHMYAGVIIIDGNRLRLKVRDWKTMVALKILRAKVREAMGRLFKHPGRDLGAKQKRWMDLVLKIFEQRRPRV